MDSSLPGEPLHGFRDTIVGQQLNGVSQVRVPLTNDFLQVRGSHSGSLHLLERLAGFDGLMLANITHQQNPVCWTQASEEVVDLLGTCQTRLVEDVQVLRT